MEILNTKEYAEEKCHEYKERFREVRENAANCKNVSDLKGFLLKADALKTRILDEMDELDRLVDSKKQTAPQICFLKRESRKVRRSPSC